MKPPIVQSVTLIGPDCWSMGSMMLVEKITGSPPAEALKVWNDGDSTYCVRPNPEPIMNKLPPTGAPADKFYDCATSAAGYAIGKNTICKVKSWKEGKPSEAKTMEFVRKNAPSIPIPEPYYYWVDEAWQRSFLLMRRVYGQCLDDAWENLTDKQQRQIAAEVAAHVKTLAQFTSPRFESVDGKGLTDYLLLFEHEGHDKSLPSFVPRIHPVYTAEQLTARVSESGKTPPAVVKEFYLFHDDLGPTNFFLVDPIPDEKSELPLLSAIIDWEGAGYYPHWWIGTVPLVSSSYHLDWKTHPDVTAWREMFTDAVTAEGFVPQDGWYWAYEEAWNKERGTT